MENKRRLILKDVEQLYLKYGIRSVTMDDVAKEFGISKKTLYQYFHDKADLVTQVIEYHLHNRNFKMGAQENGNPIDQYFALRNHYIQFLKFFNTNLEFDLKKQYPKLYDKMHCAKRDSILDNTVLNIEEGMKQGLYRNNLEPLLIAKLQVGRIMFTLNPDNGVFTDAEVANIELFDKVMENYMHSICTEKGMKYYNEQLNKVRNEAIL